MRIGTTTTFGLIGLDAFRVHVEAFISSGLPGFSIIGLPDTSLLEARERVKTAICSLNLGWPQTRITVNLSPGSMPKRGTAYDLCIAIAILKAQGIIDVDSHATTLLLGELGLEGQLLPITGVLPLLLEARKHGVEKVILPLANASEAQLIEGMEIIALPHLAAVAHYMGAYLAPHTQQRAEHVENDILSSSYAWNKESIHEAPYDHQKLDMSEVMGHSDAKHALEIAAAGGHHILLSGSPGSGKTMLASRLPSIMPPLNEKEVVEVASIRSVCGTLTRYGTSYIPPFEAPHHTATGAALAGGGSRMAQPGIITRAHRGILFLDEAPEFSSRVLQVLREPLETGKITLPRSHATVTYPARFLLILAANPCPCGLSEENKKLCTCTPLQQKRYWGRLSGPLLDRIDMHIPIRSPHSYLLHSDKTAETSEIIQKRVCQARESAKERFIKEGWTTNSQATSNWLRAHTSKKALHPILQAVSAQRLTLRGADRALRLAWSISDLLGRLSPQLEDVQKAVHFRLCG